MSPSFLQSNPIALLPLHVCLPLFLCVFASLSLSYTHYHTYTFKQKHRAAFISLFPAPFYLQRTFCVLTCSVARRLGQTLCFYIKAPRNEIQNMAKKYVTSHILHPCVIVPSHSINMGLQSALMLQVISKVLDGLRS